MRWSAWSCTLVLPSVQAATVSVEITDTRGAPVPDVVVIATGGIAVPSGPAPAVIVDQVDKAFVPQVSVIRTGTAVTFPNSDTVAHQVYSFSAPKRFELQLYRGHPHPPVTFDRPGLVVLGCNIHDNMIGYIVVTDSPWSGKSNSNGQLQLSGVPAGDYRIELWSPRFAAGETTMAQAQLSEAAPARVTFRLKRPLLPAAGAAPDRRIRDY